MSFLIEKIPSQHQRKSTYLTVNGHSFKWGTPECATTFTLGEIHAALREAKNRSKHPNRILITFERYVRR
jgi:hypothetical protein